MTLQDLQLKHAGRLADAIAAVARRGYHSAYPEDPAHPAYTGGSREVGEAAVRAAWTRRDGAIRGEERSAFGVPFDTAYADEPVDAIGRKEVPEEFGFVEFLAGHDVIAVDDTAVGIAHQLARPGVASGIDGGIDFLNPRSEARRGDKTRARRIAAFPKDEGGFPTQGTKRAGDAREGVVPAFGMKHRIVDVADQRTQHLPFGRRIMVGRKGRNGIGRHALPRLRNPLIEQKFAYATHVGSETVARIGQRGAATHWWDVRRIVPLLEARRISDGLLFCARPVGWASREGKKRKGGRGRPPLSGEWTVIHSGRKSTYKGIRKRVL